MEEVRELPAAVESERALIGCMLVDPENVMALVRHSMGVAPGYFFEPSHALICEALYEMDGDARRRIDLLTVAQRLKDSGSLEAAGGADYLDDCVDSGIASHAETYALAVRDKYFLRVAIEESRKIEREAFESDDGQGLIASVPERYSRHVEMIHREESNYDAMQELLRRWTKAKEEREAGNLDVLAGLPTPWEEVNALTAGVENALIILAGRPSAGKTTLEDELATFWALKGIPVARVALDMMWKGRVLQRSVCRMAGVSLPKLKMGFGTRRQLDLIGEAMDRLKDAPLYINEGAFDVDEICSWARAMKFKYDIQAVTIDFVQLVQCRRGGKWMNRNEEIGYINSRLKKLCTDLKIPVILLSQLSRFVRDGRVRPPRLEDLRDSGNLEQDSMQVWALYKDETKEGLEKETQKRRPVWFEVLKNQDGETGRIPLWMRPNYFRFEVAEPGHELDEATEYEFDMEDGEEAEEAVGPGEDGRDKGLFSEGGF